MTESQLSVSKFHAEVLEHLVAGGNYSTLNEALHFIFETAILQDSVKIKIGRALIAQEQDERTVEFYLRGLPGNESRLRKVFRAVLPNYLEPPKKGD